MNGLIDECREAFEEWSKQGKYSLRPSIVEGWYADRDTQTAWNAWQGAWNHKSRPSGSITQLCQNWKAVWGRHD